MNTLSGTIYRHQDGTQNNTSSQTKGKSSSWYATAILSISIIAIITLLGLVWYGYILRNTVLIEAQSTARMLQTLQDYDHTVQEEKTRLDKYFQDIQNPVNTIAVWNIIRSGNQVNLLSSSIENEYEEIKKEEKQRLVEDLQLLQNKLGSVQGLQLPSVKEVQAFLLQTQKDLNGDMLSVQALTQRRDQSFARREKLHQQAMQMLQGRISDLENVLQENNGIDFPSKEEGITYINTLQNEAEFVTVQSLTLAEKIQQVEEKNKNISREIEETKKQLVFAEIDSMRNEADIMLTFFNQRPGYSAEIDQINAFISEVGMYTPVTLSISADSLRKEVEDQVFPLLNQPRQVMAQIEEEEQRALIAQQRQAGIPESPQKEGKVILIDVPNQRLYAYENGVSLFDYPVPITTGKAGYDTVRGTFSIYHKATNFRLRSPFPDVWYDNVVSYWMPFYQGYGIHDAYWRSVYGTQDYPVVGSHGCVNTPFAEVERLYYWADIGTPVIVW